jgi:hypothetical protein
VAWYQPALDTCAREPADPPHAKQNDRFVVVLTVTESKPQFGRVMLADYLPAGFEIGNPHLAGAPGWLQNGVQPCRKRVCKTYTGPVVLRAPARSR